MTQLQDVDTAISVCFVVKIDDASLGTFSSCEGMGAEVVMEAREEGGNNVYIWQLPSRLKYSNIKLTRPLGAETSKIAAWVSSMAAGYSARPRSSRRCVLTARSSRSGHSSMWSPCAGPVPA